MVKSAVGVAVIVTVLNVVAIPAAAAAGGGESVGVVDRVTGIWYLRDAATGATTSFYYGNAEDVPFMGDWDCDGVDTPGLYRRSDGYVYLRNRNSQGVADVRYYFGNPGDVPVAGDFDGDGCDTVSIYRPAEARVYVIDRLGADDRGLGAADSEFLFGNPGDEPFAGDFDGDGRDTVGLHRESTGNVYYRDALTTGNADHQFVFGDPGDQILAGSWDGAAIADAVGVYRPPLGRFYLRHGNTAGPADVDLAYGNARMVAVAGWFGELPGGDSAPRRDGAVDPSFGSGGVAVHYSGLNDSARSIVIQSDGKIVVAGRIEVSSLDWDIALFRFEPSGVLDPSFGDGGIVTTDLGANDGPGAVVMQPDGKLLVAANTDGDVALVLRYLPNGSLDPSFAGGWATTAGLDGSHQLGDLAVLSDGRIVAVGSYAAPESNEYDSHLIIRYLPDGTLDESFGDGGRVVTTWPVGGGASTTLAVQGDGRIVVAGFYHSPFVGCAPDDPCDMQVAILRYETDGTLDRTFGTEGRVTTGDAGETNLVSSMVLQPDGKIVVVGSRDRQPVATSDVLLIRYLPDGALDAGFGVDGEVVTDFGGTDGAAAVALDGEERIIAAGSGSTVDPYLDPDHGWIIESTFAVARYLPDGQLDPTFGEYGKTLLEVEGHDLNGAATVCLQADGNIVLAGTVNMLLRDVAVLRMIGDAPTAD